MIQITLCMYVHGIPQELEQYEVTSLKRFVFSDAQATLQIHFERRLAGGWLYTHTRRWK